MATSERFRTRPSALAAGVALALLCAAAGCREGAQAGKTPAPQANGPSPATVATPAGKSQAMTGMVSQEGEVLYFWPCHTRTRVPVAAMGDQAALAAAVAEWRRSPAEALLVTLVGRIAAPPLGSAVADPADTPHLIVEAFSGVWPGETCGRLGATAQLENMYWKLTRLDGQPVRVRDGGREPHLVLHSADGRFAGSSGCNQLNGVYERDGEAITFGQVAATKMMCAELMAQEQLLLTALARVTGWRLIGQHLELLDDGGAVLLRLEERALTQ